MTATSRSGLNYIFSTAMLCLIFASNITMANELFDDVSFSARTTPGFSGFVGMGISTGGKKLESFELYYEDGDRDTASIKAGGFARFYLGARYQFEALPIALKSSIGYFSDRVSASNKSVAFKRMPLEFLGFYVSGNHEIGTGITLHTSPKYSGLDYNLDFEDSAGFVVEYNYYVSPTFTVGVRRVELDYDAGFSQREINFLNLIGLTPGEIEKEAMVDGSHFEINISWSF